MTHINVIVADDHPVVLAGVRNVFDRHEDITIVGVASDSTGVIELLSAHSVDVLVTDYEMPGGEYGDRLRYLTLLQNNFPELKVIVFTMSDVIALANAMAKSGQFHFLQKSAGVDELVLAVRNAMAGRSGESRKVENIV